MLKYQSVDANERKEVMNLKRFAKLRGRMVEIYGSQAKFANAIGLSDVTVINKLNGNVRFSLDDIADWANALQITKEQVGEYFFADKL